MKIAIIGAGNMGGAIARGLAHSNMDIKIAVADLAQDKLDELKAECDAIEVSTDSLTIVADADVVLVAVKPWLVEPVLKGALPALDLLRQIVLSIAAGVDIATITSWLGNTCGVSLLTYSIETIKSFDDPVVNLSPILILEPSP